MSTPFDPYALSSDAVRSPPSSLGLALRKIGPGLILAGSIVGTGELIQTTQTGAKAGFTLLWLVMISCFIKVFVQIELGRYAVSSGDTTLAAFRRLPGPGAVLVWWWLIMMLVTQTQLGAMVGSVGQAMHMVLPGISGAAARWAGAISPAAGDYLRGHPEMPWAVITAVSTSGFLATGSYRRVEIGTTALVVMFTMMTVVCVGLLPWTSYAFGLGELASGLKFQVPHNRDAMIIAFAMFGITGVGASELIAYPYWCIEKGYARFAGPRDGSAQWADRGRGWMRVMFLDAWVSMLVYMTATLAFYLLGAAVLHKDTRAQGLPGNVEGMLNALAEMYRPVMRDFAIYFIVAGAFAVLYSTLIASTGANCRMLADFLRVNRFLEFRSHEERFRWVRGFCIALPLIDLLLYIAIGNPTLMVTIGGVMQAVTLPLIATAAVFLRYRRTDRRLASGKIWGVFLWISSAGLYVAGAATAILIFL